MFVLSIIMGILMIIGGFSCMFTPLATFLQTGIYIGVMMFVYGVIGIARGIRREAQTLEVVFAVLALIVGLISIFRPGSTLIFDGIILNLIAVWYVAQGISSIVLAFQTREQFSGWVLILITGILSLVLGIYSFAHPMVTALTAGILIGMYFVETGINMIALAVAANSIQSYRR